MAKIGEFVSYRNSISEQFPNEGTERAAAFSAAIPDVLYTHNGTVQLSYSDDGLKKTITFTFPDDADLTAIREDFLAATNMSPTEMAELDEHKFAGNFQVTVVSE